MIRFGGDLDDLMVDVSKLRPHPANPNNGDVDEIRASLRAIGCYRPIYASTSTGHIVGGHHLYEALLSEGHQRVPVLWRDYTPEEELRALAADNAIARRARMDPGLELDLLEALHGTETGLVGTGYEDEDLTFLRGDVHDPFVPGGFGIEDEPVGIQHTCPNCAHTWTEEV
jgi:ParB-like chromosome segregation protein Spo0J